MKVSVAGAGYAALVTSACFAEMGNAVTHYTPDPLNIRDGLSFHEPGLLNMLQSNAGAGRLAFTSSVQDALASAEVLVLAFSAQESSSYSLQLVASEIGENLNRPITIVNCSPGKVGASDELRDTVNQTLQRRGVDARVDVVANPEFLKEGVAIDDFMRPDRILFGVDNHAARSLMTELYKPFTRQHDRLMFMGLRDAELARFATSAMLATRVSLMNEIAAIAATCGADMENVRRGVGSDHRIGYSYLYPGVGYGGVCLPRDMALLIDSGAAAGIDTVLLKAVTERNRLQSEWALAQLQQTIGELDGKRIAVWGLAFRPETDDVAGSPAIVLIRQLQAAGALVSAYDPLATENASIELGLHDGRNEQVVMAGHQYDALPDADALVLMTECKPFRQPDFNAMAKLMRQKVIIDGRNQYDGDSLVRNGFIYRGVGRMPGN